MAKKGNKTEKYAKQKVRTAGNKRRAWQNHIDKNPNDTIGNKKLEELLRG
jgi:hypothetical protein